MRAKNYDREIDYLSDFVSDHLNMNVTEDEAFKAACKLEKYMSVCDEVDTLLSRRTRKYGHYI